MAKILVVDDSRTDRTMIGGLLEAEGHEVIYATNGKEALATTMDSGADLVVADLQMPELDGLGLLDALKESSPLVPMILVTSKGSEEHAVKALQAGAASYVPKASLKETLIDAIDDVLEAASEQRSRSTVLAGLDEVCLRFTLPNDRRLYPALVAHIQQHLAHLELFDTNDRTRVGVALEEALVNGAEHGNLELDSTVRQTDRAAYVALTAERLREAPYKDKKLRLEVHLDRSKAAFVIVDQGNGFDPETLPDPTDPANLLKASGRGVMLMRTFMDEVNYNDVGNRVEMIKRAR